MIQALALPSMVHAVLVVQVFLFAVTFLSPFGFGLDFRPGILHLVLFPPDQVVVDLLYERMGDSHAYLESLLLRDAILERNADPGHLHR